jgi:spore coat polysaccharide biosynthesis protein SpsF
MLRTLGIVQVPVDSPGAQRKLARRVGGQPLLGWVVRRVTDCARVDGVVVLSGEAVDPRAIGHLVPLDVPVLFAAEPHAMDRLLRALDEYPAESVVRVRGDNLFVDPELIDRLVIEAGAHPGCDYVSYCSRDGRPAILSPVGVYAEWFRAKALRRAGREAIDPEDRRHVTRYVYSRPERFKIRFIPAPPEIDRDDVRLAVDVEEDWDHALAIVDALGPERLDWQRIASLLDHQPALRRRMAALNRACAVR